MNLKGVAIFLGLLFCSMTMFSQSDSVSFEEKALQGINSESTDSLKVTTYLSLASEFKNSNRFKAKYYWEMVLDITQNHETNFNKTSQAIAYNGLGIIEKRKGNYPIALDYYFKSLDLSIELKDTVAIGTAYFNLGAIYKSLKDYGKAEMYYQKSLEVRLKINEVGGIINCYNGIGVLYRKKDVYDTALLYYNRSLGLISSELESSNEDSITLYIAKAN